MTTRILLALSLLLPPLSALPADPIDFSAVASVRVGTNEVASISIGGEIVWRKRTIPYVADGLIAWYDGEWNAGRGTHSATANQWADLGPNGWHATARTSTGWQWLAKAYNGQSNTGSGYGTGIGFVCPIALSTALKNSLSTGFTVEVVFAPDASRRMSVFSQYGGGTGFEFYPQSYAGVWRSYFGGTPDVWANCWTTEAPNAVRTAATVVTGSGVDAYVDGVLKTQNTNQPADTTILDDSPHPFVLGGENIRPAMSIDGRLYCVRVYNRALTAAEVAANAAIDSQRFMAPAEEPGIYIDFDDVTAGAQGTVVEDYSGSVRFALEPTENGMGWSFWLREGQSLPATPDDISGWTIVDPGTGGDLVMLWYDMGEIGSFSGIDTDAPSFNPYGVSAGAVTVRKVPEP